MSNNNDPLAQLWQKQQTQTPDLEELSKRFKSMRRKQWFYMSVDVSSFLILAGWLYFYIDKMTHLMTVFISLMTVFSLAATIHLVWLRRFALRNTVSNTQAYLQGLKNQYINNIKIAKFSKQTLWAGFVVMVVFFVLTNIEHDWDTATLMRKSVIALVFIFGFLCPLWLWSDKRIKKYTREVGKLEDIEQSMASENNEFGA